jgi:hypothetical protein
MSRGQITKEHFKVLILQQKNKVFCETCDEEHKWMVQKHLNELIDKLEEFRY